TTDPRADVKEKVQTLASERVGRGWQKAVDTGLPTELVAVKWDGATEGAVEIRSKASDGSWSEWAHVEGDPLEGPDLDSREYRGTTAAGPVWVGRGVRRVEVRVAEGELRGLTLHALHPEEPKTARGTRPAGSATQPGIVSRAAWGADESWRTVGTGCNGSPEYASAVRFSVVHHTVNSNTYSAADSARMMRAIYHFHTHDRKWCDIGYNFIIDRFGTVFEGRAGGINRAVIGAHAQGFNSGSTGVALLGEFTSTAPSGPAYTSLRNLLAWKLELHGVNPRGTVSAGGRTISTISAHRDVGSTACPGDRLYALLPQLRNDVANSIGSSSLISLRAEVNNRYVVAENAGGAPLIANRTAIGLWEQFSLVDVGGGYVALRSRANGLYVTAENAGNSALIANRTVVDTWEKFQFVGSSGGRFALRANVNGRYVAAENAGGAPLIANRTAVGLWEQFHIVRG
ncbi:MAG: N-acetylmuramoyl-L-alanine amidase, partial [Actinobacteria bacterium]|nr:N-acetylmuramoyl-L-alanine amidase [Actinomycetota bacterium]